MSVQAITWALGKAPNIASQAVLFSLANHANEWGITYVGQDTIAEECVCRRPTVTANMAKLEEGGLIARVRRHDAGGRRSSDIVVLAPLAADRGELHDADKNAETMFSPEVCRLARQGTDRGPSCADQRSFDDRLGTDDVSLSQRGVHEPLDEPSVEPSEQSKRAGARLPDGFPEELRPHLESVCRVLRDLAARHEARDVKTIAVASVLAGRPRKPLVRAAHDFAAWADGRARRQRDVVASYRNWLDREDDRAAVERLDERGLPVGTPANGHVNGNGNGRRLRDRTYRGLAWDELTAHARESARDAHAQGLEVWDGGKDSWEGAEERRAAAAAVTAEKRRNGQVPVGAWDLAGDD